MTPTMLIELLGSMRARVRQLSTLFGVGIVLAAIALAFIAIALADWTFHLSSVWRLLFLGGAAAVVCTVIARHLLTPLRSKLPVTDVAGRVERRFPQFQDRLRSAVSFIESPTSDSPGMQRATIEQAVNLASTLPLRDVIDPLPALKSVAMGAGLIVLLSVGLVALNGATRSILLSRVLNPFSQKQWPKSVEIAMVQPIVDRVAAGGRVEVQVRLVRGDSAKARPVVFFENEAGAVRQEFLTRADDGRYTANLDARTESPTKGGAMKIWVVAGDDETTARQVQIIPRLAVESFDVAVTAPPYVRATQPAAFNLLSQQAAGLVGSGVDLTIRFSKPIAGATGVKILPLDDAAAPPITWNVVDDRTVHGMLRLDRSMRFRVDANDIDGFPAAASGEFELVAKPDQLPTAFIENPRRSEDRTVEATIPLAGLVEDDVAVTNASLVVSRISGQSPQTWTIPLMADGNVAMAPAESELKLSPLDQADGHARTRINYGWILSALPDAKLKAGDVLEYGLSVTDNYDLDGQHHPAVESGKLRIAIISQEELTNRVADELRQVKAQLEQVKQQHDRTAGETDSFKSDVNGKPKLDEADASIASRLQQQQGSVASASRSLADRLEDLHKKLDENHSTSPELGQMAKDVSERLGQTVEGSMKDAMQKMAAASQKDADDAGRQQTLEKTTEAQKQASAELADALKHLEDVGSLNAAIDNLQKMLDAQRDLTEQTRDLAARNAGKTPEQMSAGDRQSIQKLAADQQRQADASGKAIDRLGKMADQLAKNDPQTAEAMRAAQKQGKSGNVAQSQSQASQQMQQNKQSNARQSQQQAEAGLEMMLGELREAQKRKLAELQKKLAELQAQIDILIRRQSGHNLDNLTMRGALAGQEKLVAELTTLSGRKPDEATKPDAARLLAAQGQTERNARDIAKKAADVPDGAEPSARVTRAATLMERAAVFLKDKKLAEAYEPPQLDALSTLNEAKRLIDAQKQKVDDQIATQQREAIRQAYIRIRVEQEKLADETKRIESARGADHALNRADGVRLGQLPTEQQKLADEVAKVGKDLASLQSTVYIWANKQIASAMGDVKVGLASSKTDAPIQGQEKQILDDMQAMIDNLKVDPIERKFESPSGGGGAGKPGDKPLPSEAELRLMKALQTTVNVGTKDVGEKVKAAGARDEAANGTLVSLGRRQSQLRTLLDQLVSKASKDDSIGPEPKDTKPLPEEATLAQIDDQELQAELLGGAPGSKPKEIDVRRVGDRMARSHSRLEVERDAGKVTQVIQSRILDDFDLLIEAARQQQCNCKGGNSQPSPQDVAQVPKPDNKQAQNQAKNSSTGSKAASSSNSAGPNGGQARNGKDITETAEEWGKISPRLRGPVLESRDETIIERYRRLIEDYTQAVGIEASGGSSGSSALSGSTTPTTQPAGDGAGR